LPYPYQEKWESGTAAKMYYRAALPERLRIRSDTKKDCISPIFKADFDFNAISPSWHEKHGSDDKEPLYTKSSDSRQWSDG